MAKKNNRFVVAAIDFGTTYSGYAFSFKHDYDRDPLQIYCSKWHTNYESLKTPTCILFDKDKKFHSFGFKAEDKYSNLAEQGLHNDWYYFRRFKMLLYQNPDLSESSIITSETGRTMSALMVFAEAIKCLKNGCYEKCAEQTASLKDDDIQWVLTVPAIWEDTAKAFMKKAAKQVGLSSDQVLLALEPEAISVFCKYAPTLGMPTEKGKHLVLDAGGGTMDITVHEFLDGNLNEIHKAHGGDWGGTKVDVEFLAFLSEIVGKGVLDSFCSQYPADMLDLLREFEIKKKSISQDSDMNISFKLPVSLNETFKTLNPGKDIASAVADLPKYKDKVTCRPDKLTVDPTVAVSFYKSSVDHVISQLRKTLKDENVSDTGTIVMGGGFSDSLVLKDAVKAAFEPGIQILIAPEASLAVLKGAVLYGHNQTVIQSRICKYTYGISCLEPFEKDVHPSIKRYYENSYKPWCKDVFEKFVEEGQIIDIDKPPVSRVLKVIEPDQTAIITDIYISKHKNPKFTTDEGCTMLGQVVIELPRDTQGLNREVEYYMSFGDTEVKVDAMHKESGRVVTSRFEVLG